MDVGKSSIQLKIGTHTTYSCIDLSNTNLMFVLNGTPYPIDSGTTNTHIKRNALGLAVVINHSIFKVDLIYTGICTTGAKHMNVLQKKL